MVKAKKIEIYIFAHRLIFIKGVEIGQIKIPERVGRLGNGKFANLTLVWLSLYYLYIDIYRHERVISKDVDI